MILLLSGQAIKVSLLTMFIFVSPRKSHPLRQQVGSSSNTGMGAQSMECLLLSVFQSIAYQISISGSGRNKGSDQPVGTSCAEPLFLLINSMDPPQKALVFPVDGPKRSNPKTVIAIRFGWLRRKHLWWHTISGRGGRGHRMPCLDSKEKRQTRCEDRWDAIAFRERDRGKKKGFNERCSSRCIASNQLGKARTLLQRYRLQREVTQQKVLRDKEKKCGIQVPVP